MMNELQIFNNAEFGQVRTITENENILFCASDIAKALGYSKPADAVSAHCRYTVKCGIPHPQGKGTLEMNFIPEGDVYRLIIRSKLHSAQNFERWLFDKVLPSIRRTGSYSIEQKPMSQIDILKGAINLLAEQSAEIKTIKNISTAQNNRIGDIERDIESLKEMNSIDTDNWRTHQRLLINKLAKVYPVLADLTPFEAIRNELYDELEELCNCNLNIRLRNKKERALNAGTPPYKVERLNYLDVIQEEKRLITNYMMLLKNKMIKYGALN